MSEVKRKEKIQEILDNNNEKKENIDSEKHLVKEVPKNRVKEFRQRIGIKSIQEFIEDMDGFSKGTLESIEKGNIGLSLDKALKISQKYDVSLDYLFGISDFMNESEILIDKAFQMVCNPTIIKDEYELENIGRFSLELMVLNINEYLIKFLFDSHKLDVDYANNDISEYDYNYKMSELKDKLYESVKNGGKSTIPHVLIPFNDVNNDINKILDKYYKLNNSKNKL